MNRHGFGRFLFVPTHAQTFCAALRDFARVLFRSRSMSSLSWSAVALTATLVPNRVVLRSILERVIAKDVEFSPLAGDRCELYSSRVTVFAIEMRVLIGSVWT